MSGGSTQQSLADIGRSMVCGYCNAHHDGWERSPQGRRYCPKCGAIPADEQREVDEHVLKIEVGL